MSVPLIYRKLHAIMQGIKGVAKSQRAPMGYDFRGIDDAYKAAQPQFVEHGVICLPEVLQILREKEAAGGDSKKMRVWTIVEVAYNFYCVEDGSSARAVVSGEGMDYGGDKATPCAMSTAYKTMLWQAFCIRVQGQSHDTEARRDTSERAAPRASARPPGAQPPTSSPQGSTPACPKCGGQMWDNTARRTQDKRDISNGTRDKKARPAYACKDKDCGGTVWSGAGEALDAGKHDARKTQPPAPQGPSETAINEISMIAEIEERLDAGIVSDQEFVDLCGIIGIEDISKWTESPFEKIKALHEKIAGKESVPF